MTVLSHMGFSRRAFSLSFVADFSRLKLQRDHGGLGGLNEPAANPCSHAPSLTQDAMTTLGLKLSFAIT
jgi:hypothetical protein